MNEHLNRLKTTPTKELAILLSSGICGDEYKSVLSEYLARHDRTHITPSRKLKNRKLKPQIDLRQVTRIMVKTLNVKELKTLMASGLDGNKRKIVYTEYLNHIQNQKEETLREVRTHMASKKFGIIKEKLFEGVISNL